MAQVKSITVGAIFDKKTTRENMNKVIMRVSGVAFSEFTNNGTFGESVGFKGDFVCLNYVTGEVFESNACFLPKGLTAEIAKKLEQNSEVEFNAEIRPIESKKNAQGYAWVADAPMTEARLSRAAAMKKEMLEYASKLKLLATSPKHDSKKSAA